MKKILTIILVLLSSLTFAKINVVTTTTIIYDLVKNIGKDEVNIVYLCRGNQDPHFLEVLPSYMLKLRKADLVFKVGLGLEKWLPQLIDGSRNTDIKEIDLSKEIQKLEVPTKRLNASYGDIHPYGNPHYYLAPNQVKIMLTEILDALISEDPDKADYFTKNYEKYVKKLDSKIIDWKNKMKTAESKPVVFFHASWIYFSTEFNLNIKGYVEPKPGIPPSPSHNAKTIRLVKKLGIKLIVMENYYDDSAPNQIAEITGVKVLKVPVGIWGMEGINSYFDMMDYIINNITENI